MQKPSKDGQLAEQPLSLTITPMAGAALDNGKSASPASPAEPEAPAEDTQPMRAGDEPGAQSLAEPPKTGSELAAKDLPEATTPQLPAVKKSKVTTDR